MKAPYEKLGGGIFEVCLVRFAGSASSSSAAVFSRLFDAEPLSTSALSGVIVIKLPRNRGSGVQHAEDALLSTRGWRFWRLKEDASSRLNHLQARHLEASRVCDKVSISFLQLIMSPTP